MSRKKGKVRGVFCAVRGLGWTGKWGGALVMAACGVVVGEARGADMWWAGDFSPTWNGAAISGPLVLNTNWSVSGTNNLDALRLPNSSDQVRFAVAGAGNLTTMLGVNFSVAGMRLEPGTGAVSVSGSTLTTGTVGIGVAGASTLTLNSAWLTSGNVAYSVEVANGVGSLVINSPLVGARSLVKTGPGVLALNGVPSYSGGTFLREGTVRAAALPATASALVIRGATLELTGAAAANLSSLTFEPDAGQRMITRSNQGATINLAGDVVYGGGASSSMAVIDVPVSLASGARQVRFASSNTNSAATYAVVFGESISGAGQLITKLDSQRVALTAANSYSGGTQISSGELVAAATNALPVGGQVVMFGGTLNLNPTVAEGGVVPGSYSQTLGGLSGEGTVLLGGATLTVSTGGSQSFAGTVSGGVGSVLQKTGGGTLSLSGVLGVGAIRVQGGELELAVTQALPPGSNGMDVRVEPAAVLDVTSSQVVVEDVFFPASGLERMVVGAGGKMTLTGGIDTQLQRSGGGSPDVNVAPAKVQVPMELSPGMHAVTQSYAPGGIFLNSTVGWFTRLEAPISGAGGLSLGGVINGQIALRAANTYQGGTRIEVGWVGLGAVNAIPFNTPLHVGVAGTLFLDQGATSSTLPSVSSHTTVSELTGDGQIYLSGANLTIAGSGDSTFSGLISSSGGRLIKEGTGTFTFAGQTALGAAPIVRAGRLVYGGVGGGFGQLGVAEIEGGELQFGNFFATLGGVNVGKAGGGTVARLSRVGSLPLQMGLGAKIDFLGGAGSFDVDAPLDISGAELVLTNLTTRQVVAGQYEMVFKRAISGGGVLRVQGTGGFAVALTAPMSYRGGTLVEGGQLVLAGQNVLPAGGVVDLRGGALRLAAVAGPGVVGGNYDQRVGAIRGDGLSQIQLGGATLTVDTDEPTVFEGVVLGTGHIVKEGTGLMELAGPVASVGRLEIREGAVKLGQGSLTLAGVEVAGGARLELAAGRGAPLRVRNLMVEGEVLTNDNDVVVDYIGESPIGRLIEAYVAGSIVAEGETGGGLPAYLAIAEASDLGVTEYLGLPVDESTVLLKWTYVGDANLDGQVDALDYERIDLAIGNSGVLGVAAGDLNYDGVVDALDYEQVDLNIGNGVGAPLASVFVPEPGILSLIAVGGWVMMRRRCG